MYFNLAEGLGISCLKRRIRIRASLSLLLLLLILLQSIFLLGLLVVGLGFLVVGTVIVFTI